MPRIPEFEDLGSQAQVVDNDEFFKTLAAAWVDGTTKISIEETSTWPDTAKIAILPGIAPAVRDAHEGANEAAKSWLEFCAFSALHRKWVESFSKGDYGQEYCRDLMMRSYVLLKRAEDQERPEGEV